MLLAYRMSLQLFHNKRGYRMGARRVRVVLAFVLLAMSMASIGSAGAVEQSRAAPDLSAFEFSGFGDAGLSSRLNPDFLAAARDTGDELRTPQVVVGPDSRAQVTETASFPYSAVAHLELYETDAEGLPELVAICSAAFVGPNVLLTAAHCLWDNIEFEGFVDGVAVVPGANGENEPFGFAPAANIWIPDAYTTDSDPGSAYDYGLILLASSELEAATGSFEIGILTTAELTDPSFNPTTSGYPGDKPFATQWISSEQAFTDVSDVHLRHNIDSVQGQSGSPVWRGNDYTVVAVESAESDTENYAVRLDVPIMYDLMAACQELGCHLNHYLTDIPGDGGAYERVWGHTDLPVASQVEPRTWMWGPAPISKVMLEPYAEAPNGFRTVLYQEKSRMEITDPSSDASSIWYVTNGLATVELMTGNLQLGNNTFEQHNPAEINVAGDSNDPNGPTYVTFAGLRSLPPHGGTPTSASDLAGVGPAITATVDRAGNVGDDPSLATYGVTADQYVAETQHRVASPFWEFMNASGTVWQNGQYVEDQLFNNPYFATGFPITEAYWAKVLVGGTERTVLVQAFERRVLTYTPGNPEGFLVEAGNVGSHYYQWRYELIPAENPGNGGGPVDPPPAVGELLAAADFSTWPEVETTFGDTGAPVEGGYEISNPPTGFLQLIPEGSFDDAYYTLDARVTQTSGSGAACIVYRATPNEENPLFNDFGYWFCFVYEGPNVVAVAVVYETVAGFSELGGAQIPEPYPLASDWQQLGVAAQGQEFWFVVNGEVYGSIVHDVGPGSGQVGILTMNFDTEEDGPDAIFQMRNLEIYELAS